MDRETRETVAALQGFGAFSGVPEGDLRELVRAGQVTSLPERWAFLHEGTPADALYVLLVGTAEVRVVGGGAVDLEPGAVLGEMALLGHSLRRADVVTTSKVRLLRVDYGSLSALLEQRPALQRAIGGVYAQHTAERGGRD